MKRFEAIKIILNLLDKKDLAFFSTGMICREAFYLKDRPANFYMLGSMGLISAFSLGVGCVCRDKKIIIFDGDGSAFMGLGSLAMISRSNLDNIIHIVLDNGVYGSTGNQRCISSEIDLSNIAKALGYKDVQCIADKAMLKKHFIEAKRKKGPVFILAQVDTAETKAGRISLAPQQIKKRFQIAIEG